MPISQVMAVPLLVFLEKLTALQQTPAFSLLHRPCRKRDTERRKSEAIEL